MSIIAVEVSTLEGYSIFVANLKQVRGKVEKGIFQADAISVEKVDIAVENGRMQPTFFMVSNLPP